jgi:hypothetical protein
VGGVLAAEGAILVHLKTIGIVLLILHCVIISLLAFGAGEGDSFSHDFLRIYSASFAVILPPMGIIP